MDWGQKILFGIHLILVARVEARERERELMVINWLSFSIGEKKTGHSTNDKNMVLLLYVGSNVHTYLCFLVFDDK